MTTNVEKAQTVLDMLRSELDQATAKLDSYSRIDSSYSDLSGRIKEAAAIRQVDSTRYAQIAYSARLAEDLGDITTDATEDDADSIIDITREHLTEALAAADARIELPADITDRVALASYVAALTDRAAAQRFTEIVAGILEHERSQHEVAAITLIRLENVVTQASALSRQRDELVRDLMSMPASLVPRRDIAEAAEVSEPRLYQIRDGRR